MHPTQATAGVGLLSAAHQANIDAMIDDVLRDIGRFVGDGKESGQFRELEERAREIRFHLREHARLTNAVERRMFLFWGALLGKRAAREHLASLFSGRKWPKGAPGSVSSWFDDQVLIPLS
jgi:hypothetical protein